jgi:hypothetical protein
VKNHTTFGKLLILVLLLGLAPAAHALSLWYVDGVRGSDQNTCKTPVTACKTIGHAISLASPGDAIEVAAATYNEHLTISKNLFITGQSASTTIIDGGGSGTVVTIANAAVHASLSQLTIQHGFFGVSNAGTLSLASSGITGNRPRFFQGNNSGGISNFGTLTITRTTISGNFAGSGSGGGIYNTGTLGIWNSTLSGNGAADPEGNGSGGAIANSGVVTITNSTLDSNSAGGGIGTVYQGYGGALSNSGQATINNATFSGNIARCHTVTLCDGLGGAIYDSGAGTLTIQNSIVANSVDSHNCYGPGITSDGYNLSSDGSCDFHRTGDLSNTNPLLGPLQNNGGPTQTQALLAGSPAIDAGNPSGCTDGSGHLLTTDQRGMPRPDPEDLGGCDMGAYESQTDSSMSSIQGTAQTPTADHGPDFLREPSLGAGLCEAHWVANGGTFGEWELTGKCVSSFSGYCSALRSQDCPAGARALDPRPSGCIEGPREIDARRPCE